MSDSIPSPMNATEIKTRLGLILERVVAAALTASGQRYSHDFQYDEACEKPDFLIPDEKSPTYMVEVHQTDARDSFRMKILRGFTAVAEAKARFGERLASVNILFGDPANELPPSNVSAMCGFFDCNILPRRDLPDSSALLLLETRALQLAQDDGYTTEQAGREVISQHPKGVAELASLLARKLSATKANRALFPVWTAERKRAAALGPSPTSGAQTLYKRMMLRSLYLAEEDFDELARLRNPMKCSVAVQKQLLATGLATLHEDIDEDSIALDPEFGLFVGDPHAPALRRLCRDSLTALGGLSGFFEDIREPERRADMVARFLVDLRKGKASLRKAIVQCIKSTDYAGIAHSRCWVAELMALAVAASQNEFNRRMVQFGRDPENYQYPFNNITGRFERLINSPSHWELYAANAVEVFAELCQEKGLTHAAIAAAGAGLGDKLLQHRLDGAIKLQKFNPLYAILLQDVALCGLACEPIKVKSLVFDLAGGKGRLGKYNAFRVTDGHRSVLVVPVAVHDNNGDHKSKEWGARRLASLYRSEKGTVRPSEFQDAIFVIDGDWKDKDVKRLHRSGWNYVIRLGELQGTLMRTFGITSVPRKADTGVSLLAALESDSGGEESTDSD